MFRHEPADHEVARLLASLARQPSARISSAPMVLGKCQRVIKLAREAGYDKPIYLHGAMVALCDYYTAAGVDLGPLQPVGDAKGLPRRDRDVSAPPPCAIGSRRFADPVTAFASGWNAHQGPRTTERRGIAADHLRPRGLARTHHDTG